MRRVSHKPELGATQAWQGTIERLGWGGKGIGRMDDGRIVLLDSALAMFPGEVVTAEIQIKAKHAEGVVTSVEGSDPCRVEAGCPVAQNCGACQMWGCGNKYSELKRMMVDDLLHRQLPDAPEYDWHPAPDGTKRNRIQLHWDGQCLGFHAKRSNTIVSVENCPMAADPLSAAVIPLQNALASGDLPNAADRWELATDTPAQRVVATCTSVPGKAWELQGNAWLPCTNQLIHQLGGHKIAQFSGAFFQVCPEWAWDSFSRVLRGWDIQGNTLYDLYGGGGFFSLMLAGHFQRITLVESAVPSIEAAKLNLSTLAEVGFPVELVCSKVEGWLPKGLGMAGDVILLDPPRTGLQKGVSQRLNLANAKAIVLVGCDGMAFCRDIKRLSERWQLDSLAAIDLFPNTALAEFVGLLSKKTC